jgi:autotransporter translocation and assembly factor TamB
MRGRNRIPIAIAAVSAFLVAVALVVVIVLTQTDYGRERARRLVLGQLAGSVHGRVEIGRLSGNLLQGVTLSDLSITDDTGSPFLVADTVALRYSLRNLISRRVHLSDVRLVKPVIVLDKPPGEVWNFARIFPADTVPADTAARGFGSWIRINDLTIQGGRLVVRNEWTLADSLRGAARESVIALALTEENRTRIVPRAGGYQTIQELHDLDAELPLLRLADPDSTDIVVRVASLSAVAYPFRPPAARILDMVGSFVVSDDSIRFHDVRVTLPTSRLFAEGSLATGTGEFRANVGARPIELSDLQWIAPALPDSGGGTLEIALASSGPRTRISVRDVDLALEGARLFGRAELTLGDSLLLGPADLSFTGFDTRLVERYIPELDIAVDGTLEGSLALTGTAADLDVDAVLVFTERGGGQSRITAAGEMGLGEGGSQEIVARDVRIRFDPLRVALAHAFVTNLPIAGTITGSATVSGSPAHELRINTDIVHRDVTGRSRLVGETRLTFAKSPRFDVDLRLRPVALGTVGRFVPAAGLHGTASGSLNARGTLEDLGVALDLAVSGGGSIQARGRLDLAGTRKAYDLETQLVRLDAARMSSRAPATSLTGRIVARGVGTEPATMRALVTAELDDVRPDSAEVEAARVRVRIADGLAMVEQGTLRLASAAAEIEGSFGLAGARRGELAYRLQVDSLSDFAVYAPQDSIGAQADPTVGATTTAHPDSGSVTPASRQLAGSARLDGAVAGNVQEFDLRASAEIENVLVAGTDIGAGRAEVAWLGARTPAASFEFDLALDSIQRGSLAFDSLSAQVRHRPIDGHGAADLAIYKDEGHEARVRSRYDLTAERSEVRLDSLRLRLDDASWTLTEPGAVRWGGEGVEVDRIDLRENGGGRIYVDGRLPTQGTVDLEFVIEELEIGDLAALLPDTVDASGQLSVRATARGTLADPRFEGELSLVDLAYGSGKIPTLDASFDYADTDLAAHAEARDDEHWLLLVADGTFPVDLSLAGAVEDRLLDRPMRVDIRLDEFVLDSLPQFTEAVTGMRGTLEGAVAMRGTPLRPDVDGAIRLDNGAMNLTQPGLELRDVSAALTIREEVIVVDSLIAWSGDGSIRATGELDITMLTQPGFDLTLEARGAKVLDNEQGRVVIDSDLSIEGPFDSVQVAGDIDVLEGVIYIPEPEKQVIDLEDPSVIAVIDTTRLDSVVLPRPNPLLANLQVDVDVQISRNTWLRNTDANIEIYTPAGVPLSIEVDQRERALTLEGSIQTDRGEYTYAGRRFEVESGSIIFLGTPELNPLLQILARYEVPQPRGEALAILITIGGTLAEPTIRLESNAQPPIAETDLISYLAFGRSSSSLLVQGGSGVSGEGAGAGLGALATQKLAGVALGALMDDVIGDLESSGMNELGLDVFRISPAELPDELALEEGGNVLKTTELEVGKYLTPRIFVAGQGRPTRALPGVRFEYRTPRGFVWTTSWEPRYLPSTPTFDLDREAVQTRVFGSFLLWEWRY